MTIYIKDWSHIGRGYEKFCSKFSPKCWFLGHAAKLNWKKEYFIHNLRTGEAAQRKSARKKAVGFQLNLCRICHSIRLNSSEHFRKTGRKWFNQRWIGPNTTTSSSERHFWATISYFQLQVKHFPTENQKQKVPATPQTLQAVSRWMIARRKQPTVTQWDNSFNEQRK